MTRCKAADCRRFAAELLKTADPQRAAAAIGARDAMGVLALPEVQAELKRQRALLDGAVGQSDAVRRLAQLAFGRANDCVRLALEEGVDVDGLDLSLLSEIRRTDKGGVEIRLIDRLEALCQLAALTGKAGGEAEAFFQALSGCTEGEEQAESKRGTSDFQKNNDEF